MLADLVRQLRREVVGEPLRDPFAERLQDRAGRALRLAVAGEAAAVLDLADEIFVPHGGRSFPVSHSPPEMQRLPVMPGC